MLRRKLIVLIIFLSIALLAWAKKPRIRLLSPSHEEEDPKSWKNVVIQCVSWNTNSKVILLKSREYNSYISEEYAIAAKKSEGWRANNRKEKDSNAANFTERSNGARSLVAHFSKVKPSDLAKVFWCSDRRKRPGKKNFKDKISQMVVFPGGRPILTIEIIGKNEELENVPSGFYIPGKVIKFKCSLKIRQHKFDDDHVGEDSDAKNLRNTRENIRSLSKITLYHNKTRIADSGGMTERTFSEQKGDKKVYYWIVYRMGNYLTGIEDTDDQLFKCKFHIGKSPRVRVTKIVLKKLQWKWSSWSYKKSNCTETCGILKRVYQRHCEPTALSTKCAGEKFKYEDCTEKLDCFTHWVAWSSCSATCGGGKQTRRRNCTGARSYCNGSLEESRTCSEATCPKWESWLMWKGCSSTCGRGTKMRKRVCLKPNGGDCVGKSSENKTCEIAHCGVDGGWSTWKSTGPCSNLCGLINGIQEMSRLCDRPKPEPNGASCKGNNSKIVRCRPYATWCPEDHYEEGIDFFQIILIALSVAAAIVMLIIFILFCLTMWGKQDDVAFFFKKLLRKNQNTAPHSSTTSTMNSDDFNITSFVDEDTISSFSPSIEAI